MSVNSGTASGLWHSGVLLSILGPEDLRLASFLRLTSYPSHDQWSSRVLSFFTKRATEKIRAERALHALREDFCYMCIRIIDEAQPLEQGLESGGDSAA